VIFSFVTYLEFVVVAVVVVVDDDVVDVVYDKPVNYKQTRIRSESTNLRQTRHDTISE